MDLNVVVHSHTVRKEITLNRGKLHYTDTQIGAELLRKEFYWNLENCIY
jgi:hypothetical protein